jgi:hypothetical protein
MWSSARTGTRRSVTQVLEVSFGSPMKTCMGLVFFGTEPCCRELLVVCLRTPTQSIGSRAKDLVQVKNAIPAIADPRHRDGRGSISPGAPVNSLVVFPYGVAARVSRPWNRRGSPPPRVKIAIIDPSRKLQHIINRICNNFTI